MNYRARIGIGVMQVTEDGLTLLRRRTINGGMKQGNALLRNLTLAGILACFGAMGCKQAAKPDATGSRGAPAAAPASGGGSTLANPIAATPESIAQGKKVYDMECRLCHGDSGKSNGFLPMAVKLRLHDWRNPASLKDYTDGEIYTVIAKGRNTMPPYQATQTPDAMWHMVNYIRSLAKSGAGKK